MLSINLFPINLFPINVPFDTAPGNPTAAPVGYLGPSASSLPPTTLTVPWQGLQKRPETFSLLSWHTKVSQFAGREHEMQQLAQWATSAPPISVKFITGEGGVGKSRR